MGFGIEVRDGVREKEKHGCGKVISWKAQWLRGKKPKFRPLGIFISNTVENKEYLRQIPVDD